MALRSMTLEEKKRFVFDFIVLASSIPSLNGFATKSMTLFDAWDNHSQVKGKLS